MFALLLVNLVVHADLVVDTFGEPDAVRLALDAIFWKASGSVVVELASYRPRISPFYLAGVRALLDLGVPVAALAGVLNHAQVLLQTVALGVFHRLARRAAGRSAAVVATTLLACTPAFFVAGLYGMPHLFAVTALLAALIAIDRALETEGPGPWLLAAVAYLAAAGFKADTMLSAGVALAWVWARGRVSLGTAARVALAVGVPSLLVIALGSALMGPAPEDPGTFLDTWSASFPFAPALFFTARNTAVNLGTLGPVLLAVVALAALSAARDAGLRRLFGVAATAALPLLLFWCFREGNAARHVLAAVPLALIGTAATLERWLGGGPRLAWATALIVGLGYFAQPPQGSPHTPSPRLLRSAVRMEVQLDRDRQLARRALVRPAERRALIGGSSVETLLFELLRDARGVVVGPSPDRPANELIVDRPDGHRERVRRYYVFDAPSARALARELAADGWVIACIEWPLEP